MHAASKQYLPICILSIQYKEYNLILSDKWFFCLDFFFCSLVATNTCTWYIHDTLQSTQYTCKRYASDFRRQTLLLWQCTSIFHFKSFFADVFFFFLSRILASMISSPVIETHPIAFGPIVFFFFFLNIYHTYGRISFGILVRNVNFFFYIFFSSFIMCDAIFANRIHFTRKLTRKIEQKKRRMKNWRLQFMGFSCSLFIFGNFIYFKRKR